MISDNSSHVHLIFLFGFMFSELKQTYTAAHNSSSTKIVACLVDARGSKPKRIRYKPLRT
jgi:hypothetical protein